MKTQKTETENFFVKGQETWELTKRQSKFIEKFVRKGIKAVLNKEAKRLKSEFRDLKEYTRTLETFISGVQKEKSEEISKADKEKYAEPYQLFMTSFNRITDKRYFGNTKIFTLFKTATENFTVEELIQCTENAMKNPYIKESRPDILTPLWILRPENLAEYLNYKAPTPSVNAKPETNSTNKAVEQFKENVEGVDEVRETLLTMFRETMSSEYLQHSPIEDKQKISFHFTELNDLLKVI